MIDTVRPSQRSSLANATTTMAPGISVSTIWKAIARLWLNPSAQRSLAPASRASRLTLAWRIVASARSPSS